jgi:DNA-binding transcriptional ArsR family regulator
VTADRPGRAAGPAGPAEPAQSDELLAAISDPTRRDLLATLAARGPATASTLSASLPISRQAVAKHLAILQRAGLVTSTKHGRDVLFDVRTDRLAQTADWLTALATQWDTRLAAIKRLAESDGKD